MLPPKPSYPRSAENTLFFLLGVAVILLVSIVLGSGIRFSLGGMEGAYSEWLKGIDDTCLAVFTLALVWVTRGLVQAEHERSKIAERSANINEMGLRVAERNASNTELELRANVIITDAKVHPLDDAVQVSIRIANAGKTSAHKLMVSYGFEIRDGDDFDGPMPTEPGGTAAGYVDATNWGSLDPGTPLEISPVHEGLGKLDGRELVFWGRIGYMDAFASSNKPNRNQNFRYRINQENWRLERTISGNDSS